MAILVGLVLAIVAGREVGLRMHGYLVKLDEQTDDRRRELALASAEIDNNRVYIEKWRGISAFQDEPVEIVQNQFQAYLQKLSAECGFNFSTFLPPKARPMDERPESQILRYDFTFTRDLTSLVDLIASLDDSPGLLRMESVKILRKEPIRSDYGYGWRHVESPSERTRKETLAVTVVVASPAAKRATDDAMREEIP